MEEEENYVFLNFFGQSPLRQD